MINLTLSDVLKFIYNASLSISIVVRGTSKVFFEFLLLWFVAPRMFVILTPGIMGTFDQGIMGMPVGCKNKPASRARHRSRLRGRLLIVGPNLVSLILCGCRALTELELIAALGIIYEFAGPWM